MNIVLLIVRGSTDRRNWLALMDLLPFVPMKFIVIARPPSSTSETCTSFTVPMSVPVTFLTALRIFSDDTLAFQTETGDS